MVIDLRALAEEDLVLSHCQLAFELNQVWLKKVLELFWESGELAGNLKRV